MYPRLRTCLVIIALSLIALVLQAQEQPSFTVTDLKIMLADRDITIERQARQITQLQSQMDACQKSKESEKK